ncbi:MAG TPA: transcriptional repressor LexA [Bdellovibrionota bacterium]|jgi:repressor LexA
MLTPKQKNVLEFLQRFIQENGYAPSYQEIADAFGLSSRSTAQKYVERLRDAGYLDMEANSKRGVQLKQSGIHLPLLGRVAAGKPIEYHMHQEFVEVPSSFVKIDAEHFCLVVQGDSMIEAGILDGDYAVIRRQEHADNGTIVVAAVDGQATLKTLQRKKGRVELHAANPKYAPLVIMPPVQLRIEGVLTGVLRNLSGSR